MHLPLPVVRVMSGASYRLGLSVRLSAPLSRRITDLAALGLVPPRGTTVEHITLGGRPAERSAYGPTVRPRAVLYLHGGGYVVGSARMYRAMSGYLSRAAQAVVYTLDYRLAPENPYPAALEDAVAAFRELVDVHGYAPSQISIAGDSAGGGLAVAATRRLVDAGLTPAALALLSPWTDPADDDMGKRDFVVQKEWGRASGTVYRGDADPHDPGYAPMYADLSGLPPMLIHCAAHEILNAQIKKFAAKAETAGVKVELIEHPMLWHSGQQLAGLLRAATDAVDDIGEFLYARTS